MKTAATFTCRACLSERQKSLIDIVKRIMSSLPGGTPSKANIGPGRRGGCASALQLAIRNGRWIVIVRYTQKTISFSGLLGRRPLRTRDTSILGNSFSSLWWNSSDTTNSRARRLACCVSSASPLLDYEAFALFPRSSQ